LTPFYHYLCAIDAFMGSLAPRKSSEAWDKCE
jgi:hypothetical protein